MNQDLTGKTVVITGASSGIGTVAARRLAQRGATVVPVGRSSAAAAAIAAEVGTEPLTVDYARLADVRAVAKHLLERYPTIHVLAHNAGGMFGERRLSKDGDELAMQVNYLAPFLLQHLLHDRLSRSGAHIVVTSSVAHRGGRIDLDDLDVTNGRHSGSSATTRPSSPTCSSPGRSPVGPPQTRITAVGDTKRRQRRHC
jgi:NAD(P)-dependent dehydrogenase (short-subunit alcohol dehydrogenase family)